MKWLRAARNTFDHDFELRLSPEGTEALLQWAGKNRQPGRSVVEKGHRSKLAGYVVRLAGILWLMEQAPERTEDTRQWYFDLEKLDPVVPASVAQRVIGWVETYQIPTIRRVHRLLDAHPGREDAAQIARTLRQHGKKGFNEAEVFRHPFPEISDEKRRRAALKCLEGAAIIIEKKYLEKPSIYARKAGRPTRAFVVNPRWVEE